MGEIFAVRSVDHVVLQELSQCDRPRNEPYPSGRLAWIINLQRSLR